MNGSEYDVAIIGGGVTGCAVARELARYDLTVCLLEKEEDVCSGTSKANSGIVHAGFDAPCGSLKARFNVEGNRRMEALAEELDFEFTRNGSLVLCFSEEERPALEQLREQGERNGVEGLAILEREALLRLEPEVSDRAVCALYAPSGGIVCPFGLTIALAENACENGVEFRFLTEVTQIKRIPAGYELAAGEGMIRARCVVNAAGVYADRFHNMVSGQKLWITARRGEYCLLDKSAGGHVAHTVFQMPGKMGKGVLVTPTVHGNLLTGPTADDVENKESTTTTAEGLQAIFEKAAWSVRDIPFGQVITSFAGLRAHEEGDDFIVGEPEDARGFFDAAGIESPGLTSAPALGVYLAEQIAARLEASQKPEWTGHRRDVLRPTKMTYEERERLIREKPEYGAIVCRCEEISEGEIRDAMRRPLGAVSMDGIKRRVRAGMGRCQAGFCTPRVMEILQEELGCEAGEICKNRPGSNLLTGTDRRGNND